LDPIALAFIFFAIVAFVTGGIIYLIKMGKAKKHLEEAEEAKKRGDDKAAIVILKKALNNANEKPDMEASILMQLDTLYKKNGLEYDFSDFNKLTAQFQILKKKSSTKVLDDLLKVAELKKEMVEKMPELP
jgi:hypothetical protein